MAIRKTLYQVLQVARNATPEVITAAYEARLRELGASAAPEVQSERTLLKEAHDILVDAVRRKLYDDKLREEAMRALSSGGEEAPRARPASAVVVEAPGSSPMGWMIGLALLAAVAVGAGWIYFDHKHKAEQLRLERERTEAAQKLREEQQRQAEERAAWAREQSEKNREEAEWRRALYERERDAARSRSDQLRAEQQQRYEDQRKQAEERRLEAQRQAEERQNQYRAQQQLQREQQYLRELERNRPARF